MTRRRVFVTGVGLLVPHGRDRRAVYDSIFQGVSAVRLVPDGTGRTGHPALLGRVDFDPDAEIPKIRSRVMSRASQMAVLSAGDALKDAGLGDDPEALASAGIYMGCSLGGSEVLERHYGRYHAEPPKRSRTATTPMIMASGPAAHVSMAFGIRGPSITYSVACVSSAVAIGEAFRAIRDGYLDRALAGGSEGQVNPGTVSAWNELGVLAKVHADGPEASSRPFDSERTGLVLSEGAVLLVLESEESARARGATLVGEVSGYGITSDAHNLTEPHVDGQAEAMRVALRTAGVSPEEIGYVNAHATATRAGDRVEVEAIEAVFGAESSTGVSSTKSVHGHLVGAASALEAAITMEALRRAQLPPTAFLRDPDPATALDLLPGEGRPAPGIRHAISNSFAFGGSNASLVFSGVD